MYEATLYIWTYVHIIYTYTTIYAYIKFMYQTTNKEKETEFKRDSLEGGKRRGNNMIIL